jgi:hypothetical protein
MEDERNQQTNGVDRRITSSLIVAILKNGNSKVFILYTNIHTFMAVTQRASISIPKIEAS